MEYSIGSVSEIVTGGKKSPNKKRGIKNAGKSNKNAGKQNGGTFIMKKKPQVIKKAKSEGKKGGAELNSSAESSVLKGAGKKRKLPPSTSEPIQKQKKINKTGKKKTVEETPEELARTVFVGNLPLTVDTKQLQKFFEKFGPVQSARIRGVPVPNLKTTKKVALIKKQFNPKRNSLYAFVKFVNEKDADKATELDGKLFKGHHLRVHRANANDTIEENKAIFVGNLSFAAEEDDLWGAFDNCGDISSVRIVRNAKTGMGKGFGYVNFENADSVALALEMSNVVIKDRELRINACKTGGAKKTKKQKPQVVKAVSKDTSEDEDDDMEGNEETDEDDDMEEDEGTAEDDESSGDESEIIIPQPKQNQKKGGKKGNAKPFQGAKMTQKKKGKVNKGALQKKQISRQLAPKKGKK